MAAGLGARSEAGRSEGGETVSTPTPRRVEDEITLRFRQLIDQLEGKRIPANAAMLCLAGIDEHLAAIIGFETVDRSKTVSRSAPPKIYDSRCRRAVKVRTIIRAANRWLEKDFESALPLIRSALLQWNVK
jgi:hypothetical protein